MLIDKMMIQEITEQLSEYSDDIEAFWDTLDGETDILDVVGSILENIVETDAKIAAVEDMIQKYQGRESGLQGQRAALTKSLKTILLLTGQKTIPHAFATVSLRKGSESVVIHDEKEIPSQLCKVTITPDKTAIKNQLKAGVEIAGAELVTGPDTVSIRMK